MRPPPSRDLVDLRRALEARALSLGFARLGVGPATLAPVVGQRYDDFVTMGRHGTMDWLARAPERRRSPDRLWPAARSAVVVAMSYAPAADPLPELAVPGAGYVSVYARHRDYHDLLKGRLKNLAGWLAAKGRAAVKVFVDTGPVLEKPVAQAAGLGWQGKHTNLVARELGSWSFLGVLLTDLALPHDPPGRDHCGSCRRCLDICPTGAFPAPYQLDARRCVSYLTIEHAGPIPRALRPLLGSRIYGCDDCLAVCPWNRFAARAAESGLLARPDLVTPSLAGLAGLDEAGFRARFAQSPIKRIGRARLVRNVLIAIGNSGLPALVPAVLPALRDAVPVVRGAAVWALARLLPAAALAAHHDRAEPDPDVREEWAAALAEVRP